MMTEEGAAAGLSWPGLGGGDLRERRGVCGRLSTKGGVGSSTTIGEYIPCDFASFKCCSSSAGGHRQERDGSAFHSRVEWEARGLISLSLAGVLHDGNDG